MPYEIAQIRDALELVMDPEVPVLSVLDLGIVRDVRIENNSVEIVITPTYSGCPAMDMIATLIKMQVRTLGYADIVIRTVLSPAWTTDWMTQSGRDKLTAYGIAPPNPRQAVCSPQYFHREEAVQCPLCQSYNTSRISEFGSTACKSLYRCLNCQEPFDYFKCH